jgi:pilus assembly protein CpaC
MFFNNNTSSHKRVGPKVLALLLCSLAALPLAALKVSKPALATDMDTAADPQSSDGHYVRMALNKSVVIRLPANARDVIVGNPEMVDAVVRSKNVAYLFARQPGQTNVFFFDENGEQILNLNIEVSVDMTALKKLLQRTIPGTRITVDTVNNNVILGGIAANAAEADQAEKLASSFVNAGVNDVRNAAKVINTIKIGGEEQVMLKVRIVEVQRTALKQLGVNLQALLQAGKFAFNLTSVTSVVASSGIKGVYKDGNTSVTGIIQALEQASLLKTLAEPNLTAISGQPAKFHAGGQIPYETCDAPSATGFVRCDVTFKDYGISLSFTPLVLSEGRINLKVATEVSEISTVKVGNFPALDTRSAETVIELPSGGSMMLAGLIKDTTRQIVDGTPGLKTLPVLGALFRSRDYTSNQTELVVIVTPYLVGSTTEKELATPADRLNNATDRQTILLGRLNKVYGTPGKKPDGVYHGNVGFIVE